MSNAKKPAADKAAPAENTAAELTIEQAAEMAGVPVDQVLAYKDHGTHVNVVTLAGQKHRCEKAA